MSFWRTNPAKIVISALAFAGALPVLAEEISADALDALPLAEIYLLGEIHDDTLHHAHQARAVAAIKPSALVFEMLSPEQARQGQDAARNDIMALEAALGWDGSGWPEFSTYFPIFQAAPDAVLFGAALPREEVRRAVSESAASVFGEEADRFGLVTPLPEDEQAARETRQAEAHCNALPPELLPGMVEAQRLRDASFARTALEALEKTGGPVVVITGNGHAAASGMPAALAASAPGTTVLSIGQLYSRTADAPFDLWLVSPEPDRDRQSDPCDAFKG